jgi:diphthamide synthase (EF-2-diphthine--ammonia ligase)
MAFGDLFLADIRAYREAMCARLGWTPLFPLFGSDTALLARDMIAGGQRAMVCCVDTQQLDAAFSGRAFDASLLAELPAGVDPCGENGEFHTCVSAGPMFAQPLALAQGETVLRDGRFSYTDFLISSL